MGLTPQQLIRELQKQLEEEGDLDEDSYYSQGELASRVKLLRHKSPSAPYLLYSQQEEEPLRDEEDSDEANGSDRANSTTRFHMYKKYGVEVKDLIDENEDNMEDEIYEETAQQLMMYQMEQAKSKQQYDSKISEVSKSKESSSYGGGP